MSDMVPNLPDFSSPEANIPLPPLESGNSTLEEIQDDRQNLVRRTYMLGKRMVQGLVIWTEVTPLNEALRFGAYAAAEASMQNSLAVSGVYAGATLLIEGSAALATASVLDRGGAPRTFGLLDRGLQRVGLRREVEPNLGIMLGSAFLGGSAISTYIKHRGKPDRTLNQNRRYGVGVASLMSGVCGVQGYLLSNGIESPSMPSIGGAILGVGSIFAAGKWAKNKVKIANNNADKEHQLDD